MFHIAVCNPLYLPYPNLSWSMETWLAVLNLMLLRSTDEPLFSVFIISSKLRDEQRELFRPGLSPEEEFMARSDRLQQDRCRRRMCGVYIHKKSTLAFEALVIVCLICASPKTKQCHNIRMETDYKLNSTGMYKMTN